MQRLSFFLSEEKKYCGLCGRGKNCVFGGFDRFEKMHRGCPKITELRRSRDELNRRLRDYD